jgi:hypothetical protein
MALTETDNWNMTLTETDYWNMALTETDYWNIKYDMISTLYLMFFSLLIFQQIHQTHANLIQVIYHTFLVAKCFCCLRNNIIMCSIITIWLKPHISLVPPICLSVWNLWKPHYSSHASEHILPSNEHGDWENIKTCSHKVASSTTLHIQVLNSKSLLI